MQFKLFWTEIKLHWDFIWQIKRSSLLSVLFTANCSWLNVNFSEMCMFTRDCKSGPIQIVKKKARGLYAEVSNWLWGHLNQIKIEMKSTAQPVICPCCSPQDPSKKCFTLKFDLNVAVGMEKVQAVKKKTLRWFLTYCTDLLLLSVSVYFLSLALM